MKRKLIMGGIVGTTAVFLLLFAINQFPSMRGPDEWRWPYAISGEPLRQLLPTIVLLLYGVLLYGWGKRLTRDGQTARVPILFLIVVWLATAVIQFTLLWPDQNGIIQPLFFRTISAGASGVFTVGSRIENVADYLRNYPELMPTFPVHPQRYPPGLPLISYTAQQFFTQFPSLSEPIGLYLRLYQCQNLEMMRMSNAAIAASVVQMALPLFSGLVVFPLYGLANRVGGRNTAVWSIILYPLVPTFVLWAAVWDQFYPLLAVTAWYLFYAGMADRRRGLIFLAGFTVSVATFLTFGMLAMLAPMGLWALFWLWSRYKLDGLSFSIRANKSWEWGQIILDGLIFLLGTASIWMALALFFDTSLLEIWQVSMGFHLGLGLAYERWVFLHLYDFGIFLSIPILILFVISFVIAVRDLFRGRIEPFVLAFGLGLLLLDISGMSQGEVSRVWLFLTPFAVITAVWTTRRIFSQTKAIGIILLLMLVQLFVFNAFLRIITTGVIDPIPRKIAHSEPSVTHPQQVRFGDEMRLLGYEMGETAVSPDQRITITLYWQAAKQMTRPYTVFVHVVGEDGQFAAQQDNMPQQNGLPTTCWLDGEVVADSYELLIDPETAVGEYTLLVGVYSLDSGERLPIISQDEFVGDALTLTTIFVIEQAE